MNHQVIRYITRELISKGFIVMLDYCEECGVVSKTETHHLNYDNPFNIICLCHTCHINKHRNTMFNNTKPIHSEPRGSLNTYC